MDLGSPDAPGLQPQRRHCTAARLSRRTTQLVAQRAVQLTARRALKELVIPTPEVKSPFDSCIPFYYFSLK